MRTRLAIVVLAIFVLAVFAFGQSGYFTGYLTRTGQLTIGNVAPIVNEIYLNGLHATNDPNDVIINPTENSTKNVTIKVTVEDGNGNCDQFTSNNGTAYLCNGVVECNSSTANHTITNIVYNSTDGKWGAGGVYCNMSGGPAALYFYELNGMWTVNVTVTDGIDTSAPNAKNWTYGELPAFSYAEEGTVNMGSLILAQWNNGTGQDQARNTGNIILDLAWNATNFTGQNPSHTLNITGNNYIIDDDAQSPDDTGNLAEKYINESSSVQVAFAPASGLLRCTSIDCSNQNATMDVYWHIFIPAGLAEDTYQNSIEVSGTYH
jgi:hypothetical protein